MVIRFNNLQVHGIFYYFFFVFGSGMTVNSIYENNINIIKLHRILCSCCCLLLLNHKYIKKCKMVQIELGYRLVWRLWQFSLTRCKQIMWKLGLNNGISHGKGKNSSQGVVAGVSCFNLQVYVKSEHNMTAHCLISDGVFFFIIIIFVSFSVF